MTDRTDLFAEHKTGLPEEWHDTFDQLTAQGKSPSGIKATIEYCTTMKTQDEVAREYNVSDVTIRNIQTAVVALGPIDEKRESVHGSWDGSTAEDCATHIADVLGWEEGIEYSFNDQTYGDGSNPNILVEGWRDLRERIVEEEQYHD